MTGTGKKIIKETNAAADHVTSEAAAAGKDATRKLARFAAAVRYDDLPKPLVKLMKQCVLDTLGLCIGATTLAPEAKIIASYVKAMGGHAQSSILGFGGKAPAAWAAFINGSLAHMLDYDSTGDGGHTSVATIPVAFAMAEKSGGVSGRDLIAALACGADIHTRLAQSVDIQEWAMVEGWLPTQLLGYVSGAATAGRVLGLDERQMENALGIGFNQMSGSRQMAVGEAAHLRSMQAGFSGQGAVLAAELAERGIIGSKEIIEGRYGFFKTYVRTETPLWDALTGRLGTYYSLLETHAFKVWPACGITRVTTTAASELRERFGVRAQDIEAITVTGSLDATRLLCEPMDRKRRPKTSIDGKYSIPFTTAVMLVKGNVTLRDYTAEGLQDPAVLAMADRVTYRNIPDADAGTEGGRGSAATIGKTTVEVRTRDGKVYSSKPQSVPGDAENPVSDELLEAKFRDCASFAAKNINSGNIERAIEMIWDLENLADAGEITRLLCA